MKKLIKKTKHRLDSVKAFGGIKCNDCNNCSCNCPLGMAKSSSDENARVIANYKGNYNAGA